MMAESGKFDHLGLMNIQANTRRHFLGWGAGGLGAFFLNSALAKPASRLASENVPLDFTRDPATPLSVLPPQFAAKVKRVIYLHMIGAPSQLDLFDHKPELAKRDGEPCPEEFTRGKRFAFIGSKLVLGGSPFRFARHGASGQEAVAFHVLTSIT